MTIRPLDNNLVLRRDPPEERAGLIIIPDSARKKTGIGTVVATGPGARGRSGERLPIDVAAGDRVLFDANLGADFDSGGEKLTLLSADAIIGVLE